jgi:hypothetical protein
MKGALWLSLGRTRTFSITSLQAANGACPDLPIAAHLPLSYPHLPLAYRCRTSPRPREICTSLGRVVRLADPTPTFALAMSQRFSNNPALTNHPFMTGARPL